MILCLVKASNLHLHEKGEKIVKRFLITSWFTVTVLIFGLPVVHHVYETSRVLDSMGIPAENDQLLAFHRAIDTVPGASIPGGWHHREIWGHDIDSLEKLLSYDDFELSISQRKIAWAVHIIQDSMTKAGVPHESVIEARKILSEEFFKLATIRTTIRALQYAGMLGTLDFIYQLVQNVDILTALKNTLKTFGITSGITIGMNFLVSRLFSEILLSANTQSNGLMSFLSSGAMAPIIYVAIDVTLRSIETGSFTEALFSSQTLLNAAIVTLFFVPGGQFIAPGVMMFTWVFNWIRARKVKTKYELFNKVFNEEYDKYLLAQAEANVR